MTRIDFVKNICEKTAWLSPADTSNGTMVQDHAQSFISKTNRIQGLIKRSYADEGRPISEYFVPFKAGLLNPQNDIFRGLVGTEGDSFHIKDRKTQLWEEIKGGGSGISKTTTTN